MAVKITCINKDGGHHENPYVAISHLGWTDERNGQTGKMTRLQAYDWVQQGNYGYVRNGQSQARLITAVSPRGTKYVKTEANSTEQDNLLKLPEC